MKSFLQPLAGLALLALLAAPGRAITSDAFAELGLSVSVSSGNLHFAPVPGMIVDASAMGRTNAGDATQFALDHFDGISADGLAVATATAALNQADALALASDDAFFYASAYAGVSFMPGGVGAASAFSALFYDLWITDATGPVTLTIAPLFNTIALDVSQGDGRIADAYAYTQFILEGFGSVFSSQYLLNGADLPEFNTLSYEVSAGQVLQLGLIAGAGVQGVPDHGATLLMLGCGLTGLVALRRTQRSASC